MKKFFTLIMSVMLVMTFMPMSVFAVDDAESDTLVTEDNYDSDESTEMPDEVSEEADETTTLNEDADDDEPYDYTSYVTVKGVEYRLYFYEAPDQYLVPGDNITISPELVVADPEGEFIDESDWHSVLTKMEWFHDGEAITNFDNNYNLVLDPVSDDSYGTYKFRVTYVDDDGTEGTKETTFNVCRGINVEVRSPYIDAGKGTILKAFVLSDKIDEGSLEYQWYWSKWYDDNYTLIEGAASSVYTLTNTDGNYKCVVTGTYNGETVSGSDYESWDDPSYSITGTLEPGKTKSYSIKAGGDAQALRFNAQEPCYTFTPTFKSSKTNLYFEIYDEDGIFLSGWNLKSGEKVNCDFEVGKTCYILLSTNGTPLTVSLSSSVYDPDAHTHQWTTWEVEKEATCTEAGIEISYCDICGTAKTRTVAKLSHKAQKIAAVAATCQAAGMKAHYECENCGTFVDKKGKALSAKAKKKLVVKKKAHSYKKKIITDEYLKSNATCTKKATYYYACSMCDLKGKKTYTVGKALGHSYENVLTPATPTKDGSIVKKCTRCGKKAKTTKIYKASKVTIDKKYQTVAYKGDNLETTTVSVKSSKKKAISKDFYDLSFDNNYETGIGTVTITFKGNYSGTKTLTYKIKGIPAPDPEPQEPGSGD